ncbi:MAG TPA: hypothetical protein PLU37_05435 [Chitinophagaceae bacterium]|nr:hypothetical protein [Chitinophagales bacterium]HPG10952.1 hypothetical protein [Chitinophagaceae bacterium]
MKKPLNKDFVLILFIFITSRIIFSFFGIRLDYENLYDYWQYLDVETLRHNLLRGIWFDHTQPPFFNLLLGTILKLSGNYSLLIFSLFFKVITITNTLLLLDILKKLLPGSRIPIILSLIYLLSPATIVFENELFYTGFITMLFLISCRYLLLLQTSESWLKILGFFIPLVIICLTRSMYHLAWLIAMSMIVIYMLWKHPKRIRFISAASLAIILVSGFYLKNYIIFHKFSTSSWAGMNLARNVFHDAGSLPENNIGSIPPFSPIEQYSSFIKKNDTITFKGLNDKDLLSLRKNDSIINEKHISYIEVSEKYLDAGIQYIKTHPSHYLKNVFQSAISFFAPATRYTVTSKQTEKIKYYDLLYSFNISHFVNGKQQRRISLVITAIPKLLLYCFVFFWLIKGWLKRKQIDLINLFITCLIGYVFIVSSLMEHYENMRFRYEIEPLFLILLGQLIYSISKNNRLKMKLLNPKQL